MASGLATRCSACNTVFRVVPDQLRVSEGWVRCGRCAQVFNAAEALLDLETGVPRRLPDEAAPHPPTPAPAPAPARSPMEFRVVDPRFEAPDPEAPPTTAVMPVVDDSASRFAANAAAETELEDDPRADPDGKPGATPAAPVKPSFVREAERAARWRSRPVRAALWLAGLLGVGGLAGQVVYEYRDLAAARYAGLRPLMEQGCAWLGCSIGAARSINDLSVESSGLVRVERSSIYRLSVALRNRAPIDLALPALELALTDSGGQLVSRRVLTAAELGVTQATLQAGRELTLQATLQAATAPVAGYTIELFYP